MDRTVLIVAFDFPPVATSSGMQRALKAVRYLRELGWKPTVLTVDPRAYRSTNPSQLSEIPDDVEVHRAFGLDAPRAFSIGQWYPGILAWPDAWASWWPAAVRAGKSLIRKHQPAVIWSTFPINTTNLVASSLAKWSGLPWVADLRDPMSLPGYPPDPLRFRAVRLVERRTVRHSARMVFTAHHTRKIYEERYPGLESKTVVISNGYDETNFPAIEPRSRNADEPFLLLHSGAMQPKGRNPEHFFAALEQLKSAGHISAARLRVRLRACGQEERYRALADAANVSDIVEFGSYLPYDEALEEMVGADALLVFQGTAYNHAVPAKLYEYLYARKPILGVLDPAGETRRVLADVGIAESANIADAGDIARHVGRLLENAGSAGPYVANPDEIPNYSRRRLTGRLAELLETVVREHSAAPATG